MADVDITASQKAAHAKCDAPGCEKERNGRRFCPMHASRLLRLGTLDLPPAKQKAHAPITSESLRALFDYNPETGIFTNLVQRNARALAGSIAGTMRNGYSVIKLEGKQQPAHQLAWLYVHGSWPTGQIDHINGAPSDNRICNLRDVPAAVNYQNTRRPRSHNRTGTLGVSHSKGRFRAIITLNG